MISLTKIIHFEMAHAIDGYPGACKNIHGHSYELHVTVTAGNPNGDYLPAPGFILDFKELKRLVNTIIEENFDHKLVLSEDWLRDHPAFSTNENLVSWKAEPTAENMLLFMQQQLTELLPQPIQLVRLKLFETKDSYAEWTSTPQQVY